MESISAPLSRKYNFLVENWRDIVKVQDRKLLIQVHNTWNVIDQQVASLKYNKDRNELEASSIIKLENVFVDHNIALVFALEYQFKIKVGKGRGEIIHTRIGYCLVIPEAGKAEFKRTSFMSEFECGPKPSLDDVTQWTPTTIVVPGGRDEEPIAFHLKGIMAPTETLRKLKGEDEEPKIIKVRDDADRKKINELEETQKHKESLIKEEKKLREKTEEEVIALKRKVEELKEAKKLAEMSQEPAKIDDVLEEKNKKIQELEKKLDETQHLKPEKTKHRSGSKSKSKDRREDDAYEDDRSDMSPAGKRTVIKRGMDADEVMQLIKTVLESTKTGVPLETQTLGKTGVLAETMSKEFIEDLQKLQRDKVAFVGSKGGHTVMNSTALTRRDKIHLMKLGLGKGLMDKELEGM